MKTVIKTGTTEDFFARGRDLARRADRHEKFESQRTITFEDPVDLLKLLTPAKLDLFFCGQANTRLVHYRHFNAVTSRPQRSEARY